MSTIFSCSINHEVLQGLGLNPFCEAINICVSYQTKFGRDLKAPLIEPKDDLVEDIFGPVVEATCSRLQVPILELCKQCWHILSEK